MVEEKTSGKKPIYRQWWFWVIIGVIVLGVASGGGKKKEAAVEEKVENVVEHVTGADRKNEIEQYMRNLASSTIAEVDSINVNEDYGTEIEDDYILLMHLRRPDKAKWDIVEEQALAVSRLIKSTAEREFEDIEELCIFWDFNEHGKTDGKISFERGEDGTLVETDRIWPH